ncbi:hypothetical protein HPB50_010204 [Hyalomma asiaticum]|uniref:Uncharacterized protein n=1 Tax=Hyalomma asiaticum TaxID=266040 RepID=A0ACB7S1R4_HYAAI|nr:hypothetical protein HPB50_010204 [Hyalomma asiaticum]
MFEHVIKWPSPFYFLFTVADGRPLLAVGQGNGRHTPHHERAAEGKAIWTTAEPEQNASAVQTVQPGNATSLAFPSCANDAGCPGALMCVEGTCGCPFSRPVIILGGKDKLGPLCEPLRGLHEHCVWAEQCSVSDPGLDCRKGVCQCVGRPSPWGGVCRARSVTKPLIWAICFAVIALIVAGLMFCFAQSPSRHKSACFSESCLLSASTGSVLHNPAAQRLLFSRRKEDSAGDTRRIGCSRGSTPREGGHCTSAMSAASSHRSAPAPLPRGFLSCHGLPLDDPRGDLGRSSCSLAAEAPNWPPIVFLGRSEPSLELQVISLDTLSEPLASVHSVRRASAPALAVSPCRSEVDASQASAPHVHSEGGEPAAAQPGAAHSVGQDWISKLGEQLANDSYGFTLDISQSSLPAVLSTVSGAVDAEQRRASRQSRLRSEPLASVHSVRRASAPALVVSPCRSEVDASQASAPHVHSEGGEPAAAQPGAAHSVGQDWISKLGEQLANDSYGFTLDISQSSLPAVLSTVSGAVDAEQRRASRQSRLRRNISESLRRELADAWRCSGTLPSSRLLLQPPAFLSPEHLSSAAPESPGSD